MAFSTPVPARPLSSMTSPTVIDIFDALHPQTILAYGTIGLDRPILMERFLNFFTVHSKCQSFTY